MNKEKDAKGKETISQNAPSSKALNGKVIKPKIEIKDNKANTETRNNLDFDDVEVLKTEELAMEPEIKAVSGESEALPNGTAEKSAAGKPKEQVKKVKYLEKIKEEVWKNNVLEYANF